MKEIALILFIPFLFYLSCTPYKNVPYFQDLPQDSTIAEQVNNLSSLTVQSNDLLGINVSSLNHEADMIYNYNLNSRPDVTGLDRAEQNTVVGYLVDGDGNIKLPNIGKIKVAGFTTTDIAAQLELKLKTYLLQPSVNVRVLNFKVSVLGDVKNPGSFSIQSEQITLPQALSYAGDLNTTGKRTNVLIIRETNGKREYARLDLTSKSTFDSPYFYLKNNDVVYVQPGLRRVSADYGSIQKVGIGLSVLTIIAYIITR